MRSLDLVSSRLKLFLLWLKLLSLRLKSHIFYIVRICQAIAKIWVRFLFLVLSWQTQSLSRQKWILNPSYIFLWSTLELIKFIRATLRLSFISWIPFMQVIHIYMFRFSVWLWDLVVWKVSWGVDELHECSWMVRMIWMMTWCGIKQDVNHKLMRCWMRYAWWIELI